MDLDAFDANELIHSVWELRQTALQLGESSGTKFLCPNCEQLKPFAGDKRSDITTTPVGWCLCVMTVYWIFTFAVALNV